jgi:hypothetical protein
MSISAHGFETVIARYRLHELQSAGPLSLQHGLSEQTHDPLLSLGGSADLL